MSATELIVVLGPPANAASGEANTSSNEGTGEGLALPKAGVNLPFKTIKATGQASLSTDTDSITIEVPKTAPLAHESTHNAGGSDPIEGAALETTITPAPTNYTPTANTIKGQFDGVDNAIGTKEPNITATTAADYYRGDKTFQPLNKTAVGLANVDNTSDANKPISTATQTALDNKVGNIVAGEPTGADPVLNMVSLTQAEFDAGTPISTTLYLITDA